MLLVMLSQLFYIEDIAPILQTKDEKDESKAYFLPYCLKELHYIIFNRYLLINFIQSNKNFISENESSCVLHMK